MLLLISGAKLYATNQPEKPVAVTVVKGNFSEINIPTPTGYLAVSKVDPVLKEMWEGNLKDPNLKEPEKLAVYVNPTDKISIQHGQNLTLIRQAFVATNPNFGNGFYNNKDFESYRDSVRDTAKKVTKNGLESVAELVEAERQLTYPITDVTMVLSSFATNRILLTVVVATEPDTTDNMGQPLRFGKVCAFVNVRGNLVCCYIIGKATELVQLESDCFKWSEEIVAENPSTMFERWREAYPFHSALTD